MSKCWLAVASADHVARGHAGGFMQVCHGKAAPLRRLKPGDQVVYYSPVWQFGSKARCQHFTAVGTVTGASPYQVGCSADFQPYRLDVQWEPSGISPIQPLLPGLAWTQQQQSWGYKLRFGCFEVSANDLQLIRMSMLSSLLTLPAAAPDTAARYLPEPAQGLLALDPD